MGFNLGAFAGGIAKGGMDTYMTLQTLDERQKERALREKEFALREAAERRTALEFEQKQRDLDTQRSAAAESYGRVGKAALTGDLRADTGIGAQQAAALEINSGDAGFDAADRAQLADTLRANAAQAPQTAETAALNPARPTMTKDMAADEYSKRLYAAGMTEKAQQAEAAGLQISAAKRKERYDVRQENALGFQQNVLDDLKKNKGDIGAVLEKHFIPLYNENKLPGLSDGGTAKVVPGAMGSQPTIVITDKNGKETSMPADIATLQSLTSKAQDLMMASASPENYWKHKEQFLKERQVGAQELSAQASAKQAETGAAELKAKIEAQLFKAQAGQANAAANQANAHAQLYNSMSAVSKSNKDAREAMQPHLDTYAKLTDEEKAGSRGQQVLMEAAVAAAQKTGDVTGLINSLKKADRSGHDAAWNDIEKELYKQGTSPADISTRRTQFYADRGFAPAAAIAAIESGKGPKGKLTEADVDSFNAKFPNSKVDKSSLSWLKQSSAIPAKTESAPAPQTPIPTTTAGNPYRNNRGVVDQASLQADMAEYNQLANSALPLAAGRRKALEQKLRAAGAIE